MTTTRLLPVLAALAVTSPGLARADDEPVEVQIVDALNKVFSSRAQLPRGSSLPTIR